MMRKEAGSTFIEPVSLSECAERQGVNLTAVRYWIQQGQVAAQKYRGEWVLDYATVPDRSRICIRCQDCGAGFESHKPRRGQLPRYCSECKAERRRASWRRSYRRRLGSGTG